MNAASKNTYISKNMMALYKEERAKRAGTSKTEQVQKPASMMMPKSNKKFADEEEEKSEDVPMKQAPSMVTFAAPKKEKLAVVMEANEQPK